MNWVVSKEVLTIHSTGIRVTEEISRQAAYMAARRTALRKRMLGDLTSRVPARCRSLTLPIRVNSLGILTCVLAHATLDRPHLAACIPHNHGTNTDHRHD